MPHWSAEGHVSPGVIGGLIRKDDSPMCDGSRSNTHSHESCLLVLKTFDDSYSMRMCAAHCVLSGSEA
jgi:hypothetical protein